MSFYSTFLCSLLFILSQCSILADSFDYDHTPQSDRYYDSSYLNPPGLSTGYPENSPYYSSFNPNFPVNSGVHTKDDPDYSHFNPNDSRFNLNHSQYNSNNLNYYPDVYGPAFPGQPVSPPFPRNAYPGPKNHTVRSVHPGNGDHYYYMSTRPPALANIHPRLRPRWLKNYRHGVPGRPPPPWPKGYPPQPGYPFPTAQHPPRPAHRPGPIDDDGFIPIPKRPSHPPGHLVGPHHPPPPGFPSHVPGFPPHGPLHPPFGHPHPPPGPLGPQQAYPPGYAGPAPGFPDPFHMGPPGPPGPAYPFAQGFPGHPPHMGGPFPPHGYPGLGPGYPFGPQPVHAPFKPAPHTPPANLIILDIGYTGPTNGYSVTINGPTRIFTAIPPFLFAKVIMGPETVWSYNNNGYPNKVVYKLVNGEYRVFVHFPPETTDGTPVKDGLTHVRAGLIPVKGIKPSKGPTTVPPVTPHTGAAKLNINLSYKGPILVDDTGQSYINITIPSVADKAEAPRPTVKPLVETQVCRTGTGTHSRPCVLRVLAQDPNDASKTVQIDLGKQPRYVNAFKFAKYSFGEDVKCSAVKYQDQLVWRLNAGAGPGAGSRPQAVVWNEAYCLVLLQFEDHWRFFLKNKFDCQWRSRTIKNADPLSVAKVRLFTKIGFNLVPMNPLHYSFRDLGFAFEYVFVAGARCERVSYGGARLYNYNPRADAGRYPAAVYLFADRSGHVFYPRTAYYLHSPFQGILDLKNSKKPTDRFDRFKDGKVVTYFARPGFGFSKLVSALPSSCCRGRPPSSSAWDNCDDLIWDGKDSPSYAIRIILTGKGKKAKFVTVILSDGSKRLFAKDKKSPWREIFQPGQNSVGHLWSNGF